MIEMASRDVRAPSAPISAWTHISVLEEGQGAGVDVVYGNVVEE
jgi:hypothetical protein